MLNPLLMLTFVLVAMLCVAGCAMAGTGTSNAFQNFVLNFETPVDPALQSQLEKIDASLRDKFGFTNGQSSVGLLDLNTLRLAMIQPDHEEYGASVPKIAILLAYFQLHPDAATNLSPEVRHELGLMIKISSNEMAAKYSMELGLKEIRAVLASYHFYDTNHGGGIWVGKHYGSDIERQVDPVGGFSHAATVRQLLRYYVLLEQGRLVSPVASKTMREIFESPEIPHDEIKFVKGLAGRGEQIIRKSGSWEDWLHDTAVVTGSGRHYILVALTKNPQGDEYLAELASAVDDLIVGKSSTH